MSRLALAQGMLDGTIERMIASGRFGDEAKARAAVGEPLAAYVAAVRSDRATATAARDVFTEAVWTVSAEGGLGEQSDQVQDLFSAFLDYEAEMRKEGGPIAIDPAFGQ